MDIMEYLPQIVENGVWCILFVYLFLASRKDCAEREAKLMSIVESQGNKLTEISTTLKSINERIERLEEQE